MCSIIKDDDISLIKYQTPSEFESAQRDLLGSFKGTYLNEALQKKEFVLNSIRDCGKILILLNKEFRGDYDIVLAAVNSYGYALSAASENLRCNKEIALAAVKSEGYAYEALCDQLKFDKEILKAAIYNNPKIYPSFIAKSNMDYDTKKELLKLALISFDRIFGETDTIFRYSINSKNNSDHISRLFKMFIKGFENDEDINQTFLHRDYLSRYFKDEFLKEEK
jgi:hypothetical protein